MESGSGESGVGGTGISFARGRIISIDGKGPNQADFSQITIVVGNKTTAVAPNGNFELADVSADGDRLALNFINSGNRRVGLDVGSLSPGDGVVIDGIRLNFPDGTADADSIRIIPASVPATDDESNGPPAAAGGSQGADGADDEPGGGGSGSGGLGAGELVETVETTVEETVETTICFLFGLPGAVTLTVPQDQLQGFLNNGAVLGPCPSQN